MNDGSTDRSLDIAMSVKDPRVRVLSDKQNRRLPYRLNQITSEASYDLIARMDADDLISPTRFAKQVEILDTNAGVDIVTTGICSISNRNQPIGVRGGISAGGITGRKLVLGQCAVVHAAMVGRRAWFLRNPYNESANRMEDYDLWLRTYRNNDFNLFIMGDPLYYYREDLNVTSQRQLIAYAGQRQLMKEYGPLWFAGYEVKLMIAKSHCKSLAVRVFAACNRMDVLLNHRNSSIEDLDLLAHFNTEIKQILRTRVPGFD